jgi:hypothetical protein
MSDPNGAARAPGSAGILPAFNMRPGRPRSHSADPFLRQGMPLPPLQSGLRKPVLESLAGVC